MLLGLIRPTAGSRAAVRPRPAQDGRAGAGRRGRLRRGAALLPLPERPQEPRADAPRSTAATPPSRIDEALDVVDLRRPCQGQGRRLLARHEAAAGHRRRAAAQPAPAAAGRAHDRARPGRHARHARRSCGGLAERGHDGAALQPPDGRGGGAVQPRGDRPHRARSSTRASSTSCCATAGPRYRLRTTDDAARAAICAAQPGVEHEAAPPATGSRFAADERRGRRRSRSRSPRPASASRAASRARRRSRSCSSG